MRRRSYCEPLVVDIAAGVNIDPEMLAFDLVLKSDGTAGIEHVSAEYKPTPVPPEELERARQHQEFCAKRAQQLHDQGVAFDANTTSFVNFIEMHFARPTAPTHRLPKMTLSPTPLPIVTN